MTKSDQITILQEYKEKKELVAAAEKRINELREQILTQIGAGKHGDWIVLVEDQERESFSLKDAKASVTPSVWEKISGFVKTTAYKTLKVSRL